MFSFLDKGLSDIRGSTLFEGEPTISCVVFGGIASTFSP